MISIALLFQPFVGESGLLVEIESSLFGINSTNLVDPQPEPCPMLKTVPEKAWFATPELIMPKELVVSTRQRPFPIPN